MTTSTIRATLEAPIDMCPLCKQPRMRLTLNGDGKIGSGDLVCGCSQIIIMREPEIPKQRMKAAHVRRLSRKQDKQVAEDLHARVQPASGALVGSKGDVRALGRYRVETKWTQNGSFRLTRAILHKIRGEAGVNETPTVVIDFKNANGQTEDRWVVMPYRHWISLQDADNNRTSEQPC